MPSILRREPSELCDLTHGKQGSGLYSVRRRQQSGGMDGGSLGQRSLDQGKSLSQAGLPAGALRRRRCRRPRPLGVLGVWSVECALPRSKIRPAGTSPARLCALPISLRTSADQVLVTNGAGDPERVLEQWQRLVRPALPYQDIGPVVVCVGGVGRRHRPGENVSAAWANIGSASGQRPSIDPTYGQVVQHMGLLGEVPQLLEDAQRSLPMLLAWVPPDHTSTRCSTACALACAFSSWAASASVRPRSAHRRASA